MSVSQRVAQYAGLFLRHGVLARVIAHITLWGAGLYLMYFGQPDQVAAIFYVWYFSMVAAQTWMYARDTPLRTAFEPAPARYRPLPPASGRLSYNVAEDKRTIEEQLDLVATRGRVNTNLVFNRLAVWLGISLRLQATTALVVWTLYLETRTFEISLFVALALIEHMIELNAVEALRMFVMSTGNEAVLLSAVWHLDVEPVHDAAPTRQWTTRDAFLARETGHKEATLY
jgi:hypothetical protein